MSAIVRNTAIEFVITALISTWLASMAAGVGLMSCGDPGDPVFLEGSLFFLLLLIWNLVLAVPLALLLLGKYDLAGTVYRSIPRWFQRLYPGGKEYYFDICHANALALSRQYDQAEKLYSDVIEKLKKQPLDRMHFGRIATENYASLLIHRGRVDAGTELLKSGRLSRFFDFCCALSIISIVALFAWFGWFKQPVITAQNIMLDQVLKLADRGKVEQARNVSNYLSGLFPHDGLVQLGRAQLDLRLKQPQKALEDCERGQPDESDAEDYFKIRKAVIRAEAYVQLKQYDKAVTECDAAIKSDPQSTNFKGIASRVYRVRAEADEQLGRLIAAKTDRKKSNELADLAKDTIAGSYCDQK